MCAELTLTDAQKRAAERLRALRDTIPHSEWEAKVAKAVDGMGGPLANEFCDIAGVK